MFANVLMSACHVDAKVPFQPHLQILLKHDTVLEI